MDQRKKRFSPIFSTFSYISSKMYNGITKINALIHNVFQALPFLYTLLAIICIVLALIIIILLLFSKFLFFPAKYATFIDINTSQQIYSTLHLLYSFLLLCAIVHVTFYNNKQDSNNTPIKVLGDILDCNGAGIIIIQVILVSIIVIFMFLMSVVSNALSKTYYTIKVRETNIDETPSMSGWAKIVDLIMYISCIISSILLIFFFIIKIFLPDSTRPFRSSIQTFFVISIVYYIAQLFLQMLRDVISDNLLSFVIPSTHTNKMLHFVLNIILAILIVIIVWVGIIYNLMLLGPILEGSGAVIDGANKTNSLFYGIVPQELPNFFEPYLKKAGIDPDKIQRWLEKGIEYGAVSPEELAKFKASTLKLPLASPEQASPKLQQASPALSPELKPELQQAALSPEQAPAELKPESPALSPASAESEPAQSTKLKRK